MTDSKPATETHRLMRRVANQDALAYREVFSRYAPRVCGYLVQRGVPRDQADELTQDIMLQLWRKARQFDPDKGAARAWIFRITRNALIDRSRRQSARPQTDELKAEPIVPVATFPPGERRHDANKVARWAHANLDESQNETLRLAYVEGLSTAEIARRMGVPQGTVKSRLRLALQALRAAANGGS